MTDYTIKREFLKTVDDNMKTYMDNGDSNAYQADPLQGAPLDPLANISSLTDDQKLKVRQYIEYLLWGILNAGADGEFEDQNGKTITVKGGIITSIS